MPKWSKFGRLSFNKALLWPWPLMEFCIWQEKYSMLLQCPNLKAVYLVTSKQDWPRQEKLSLRGLGGCDHFLKDWISSNLKPKFNIFGSYLQNNTLKLDNHIWKLKVNQIGNLWSTQLPKTGYSTWSTIKIIYDL